MPVNTADSHVQSQNEKTTLLGKTKQDYASILKWLSYFNVRIQAPHLSVTTSN